MKTDDQKKFDRVFDDALEDLMYKIQDLADDNSWDVETVAQMLRGKDPEDEWRYVAEDAS